MLRDIEIDSKAQVLVNQLDELRESEHDCKVIVFTQFRETQRMLQRLLTVGGWTCDLFHGQLDVREKDKAIERFRDAEEPAVLISTEAGGEGTQLAVCAHPDQL